MKHHPVTLIYGIGCCIDYYILHKLGSNFSFICRAPDILTDSRITNLLTNWFSFRFISDPLFSLQYQTPLLIDYLRGPFENRHFSFVESRSCPFCRLPVLPHLQSGIWSHRHQMWQSLPVRGERRIHCRQPDGSQGMGDARRGELKTEKRSQTNRRRCFIITVKKEPS